MPIGSTCTLHAPSISTFIGCKLSKNADPLSVDVIEEGLRCPDHPELFLSASMYFLHQKLRQRLGVGTQSGHLECRSGKSGNNVYYPSRSRISVTPSSDTALSLSLLFSTIYQRDYLGGQAIQQKTIRRLGSTQSLPVPVNNNTDSCLLLSKYVSNIPYKEFVTLQHTDKYNALLESESMKPIKKLKIKQILPVARKCKTHFKGFFSKFRRSNRKNGTVKENQTLTTFSPSSSLSLRSTIARSELGAVSRLNQSIDDGYTCTSSEIYDARSDNALNSASCSKIYTRSEESFVSSGNCDKMKFEDPIHIENPSIDVNDSRFRRKLKESKSNISLQSKRSDSDNYVRNHQLPAKMCPIKIRYICKIPKSSMKFAQEGSSCETLHHSASYVIHKSAPTEIKTDIAPKMNNKLEKGKQLCTKLTVNNLSTYSHSTHTIRESPSKLSVCYEDDVEETATEHAKVHRKARHLVYSRKHSKISREEYEEESQRRKSSHHTEVPDNRVTGRNRGEYLKLNDGSSRDLISDISS